MNYLLMTRSVYNVLLTSRLSHSLKACMKHIGILEEDGTVSVIKNRDRKLGTVSFEEWKTIIHE